jgi:16S rRNA (guanine(966)-N(2))-methyltransferase RsmD
MSIASLCLTRHNDSVKAKTRLRIVGGSLRGRKLTCLVEPGLRPTPDMVREALFNILADVVPGRPFFDLFAGTGAVGLEALSRGASAVEFIERDPRLAGEILHHLQAFGVADRGQVHRADVYRWVDRWRPSAEPVTLFLGPPFPDFEHRLEALLQTVSGLAQKSEAGSVLVLQSEKSFDPGLLPDASRWDQRLYGRNRLSILLKE